MHDPRVTPARGDIAAKYLEGKIKADRFVTGEDFEVNDAIAPVRRAPMSDAEQLTQALKGERVTVYETTGEGWCMACYPFAKLRGPCVLSLLSPDDGGRYAPVYSTCQEK